MWQVLRRYQGVDAPSSSPPTQQKQQHRGVAGVTAQNKTTVTSNNYDNNNNNNTSFQQNQRTIALHEWKEHAVNPQPPSLAMPYDRYVYEKMLRLAVNVNTNASIDDRRATTATKEKEKANNNEEKDPSAVEIQRRALANLIQLLFEKPQNIHHLVKEPALLPTVVATSCDPDEDVRRATCVLLRLIAQDRRGAEFLFTTGKDEPAKASVVDSIARVVIAVVVVGGSGSDESVKLDVRRRLADVGEGVRCLISCCLESLSGSCAVATEALRAMAALHGFADTPEYTFALMRARCVPVYSAVIKKFAFSNSSSSSSSGGGGGGDSGSNRSSASDEEQQIQCCTAALACLRLVTNAKEAFLEVLNEDVLGSSLQIVIDYVAHHHNENEYNRQPSPPPQQQQQSSRQLATTTTTWSKLLCAALSVITELVLYTAGSNAAARRQESRLRTLLPCAKLSRLHPDPAVRRDAAGALATLCVSEIGKAAAFGAPQEQGVIDLVKDSIKYEDNRDVVSSMCRVVCLLSELPAARQMLVDIAEPLKEIARNAASAKDASLEEGATRAAKLVVWVPGQE